MSGALHPTWYTLRPQGRPLRDGQTEVFDPQARIAELERRVAALERQHPPGPAEARLAGQAYVSGGNPLRVIGSPPRMHTGPCWGSRTNGCSCFD